MSSTWAGVSEADLIAPSDFAAAVSWPRAIGAVDATRINPNSSDLRTFTAECISKSF
jgi:hypothetical protein